MQKLTISADLAAKIDATSDPTELCDETGATRGVVLPLGLYHDLMRQWTDRGFDESELARARTEAGGYTTAEAIAFVNKLAAGKTGP